MSASIVDRDGYAVRTLAARAPVAAGRTAWQWDGRDDGNAVVPDEAYSLKIDWQSGAASETWFPANAPAPLQSIPIRYYDRRGATLVYTLPRPSRVHIQAGSAVVDRKRGTAEGPVMKTIVNREPRVAGSIAEHWDGMDESGTIYVPDTPHFVISIAATPLPESSILTVGNHSVRFLDAAARRRGKSLFTAAPAAHAHHAGLPVLADVSPGLTIEPVGARWSARDRAWKLDGPTLRLNVAASGPAAETFAAEPGTLFHFVNYKLAGQTKPNRPSATIDVAAASLRCGVNTLSVNWRSDYGAVAANSLRLIVARGPEGRPCMEARR